jgi:hypothetical protein
VGTAMGHWPRHSGRGCSLATTAFCGSTWEGFTSPSYWSLRFAQVPRKRSFIAVIAACRRPSWVMMIFWCWPGLFPVCSPWGPVHMGTTPGPLPIHVARTPSNHRRETDPGSAQALSALGHNV